VSAASRSWDTQIRCVKVQVLAAQHVGMQRRI
jgi:hypothetical protein